MVVLSEKVEAMFPPPPPYESQSTNSNAQVQQSAYTYANAGIYGGSVQVAAVDGDNSALNGLAPAPPPFPGHTSRPSKATFSNLPSHILLYIIHQTLPQEDLPGGRSVYGQLEGEGKLERQRKVLYWMSVCLRLVSRGVYIGKSYLRSRFITGH